MFCTGTLQLRAQSDSEYYSSRYFTERRVLSGSDSLSLLDSSMDDFHLYHPAFRLNFGMMDLGNSGTPMYPVTFQPSGIRGFDLGWHYLDAYLFLPSDDNRYYNTRKPITSLFYHQGAEELIGLQALHSQNIKPNWNMGIDFRRMKEDGFYFRQNTSLYNTRIFNSYHTKSRRYHLLASATFNRIVNTENGGILSRESFDTLAPPVRTPVVAYQGFSEARNELKTLSISATQVFRLGQKRYFPTEALDSLNRPVPDTNATFIPQSQISLRTSFSRYRNIFRIDDLGDMPFTEFLKDSISTYDSLYFRDLGASIGFQLGAYRHLQKDSLDIKRRKWYFAAYADFNHIRTGWQGDYAEYTNIAIRGEAATRSFVDRGEGLHVGYYQGITGYNSGDFELKAQARQKLRWIRLGASYLLKQYAPDFNSLYYFGNHHFWHNRNFKKQLLNSIELRVSDGGPREWWSLTVSDHVLQNFIYLAPDERPVQNNTELHILKVELQLKWKYRWMNLQSHVIFHDGDIDGPLPLPQWVMKHSLFAEGFLFKKNLRGKVGIDLFISDEYAAPVYVAPLRSWRVQQGPDAFTIGNYPWINLYASGRIKTFTFFVMFQHVNANLTGRSYFSSPYYPMQPRSFRLGIRWKLYE